MDERERMLVDVNAAFAGLPKPAVLLFRTDEPGLARLSDLLGACKPEELIAADLGEWQGDPSMFMTPEAIRYFFPSLARIAAFDEGEPPPVLSTILLTIYTDKEIIEGASKKQCLALERFLKYLVEVRYSAVFPEVFMGRFHAMLGWIHEKLTGELSEDAKMRIDDYLTEQTRKPTSES